MRTRLVNGKRVKLTDDECEHLDIERADYKKREAEAEKAAKAKDTSAKKAINELAKATGMTKAKLKLALGGVMNDL